MKSGEKHSIDEIWPVSRIASITGAHVALVVARKELVVVLDAFPAQRRGVVDPADVATLAADQLVEIALGEDGNCAVLSSVAIAAELKLGPTYAGPDVQSVSLVVRCSSFVVRSRPEL